MVECVLCSLYLVIKMIDFSISKEEKACIVTLSGELNFRNMGDFKEQFSGIIQRTDIEGIMLNLANVKYADSSALGDIFYAFFETTKEEKKFTIVQMSDFMEKMLRKTNMLPEFTRM